MNCKVEAIAPQFVFSTCARLHNIYSCSHSRFPHITRFIPKFSAGETSMQHCFRRLRAGHLKDAPRTFKALERSMDDTVQGIGDTGLIAHVNS